MSEQQWFRNELAAFVATRTYLRFSWDKMRRETWEEAVQRVTDFLVEAVPGKLTNDEIQEIHDSILSMKCLPSMRLMAMAGEAGRRNQISLYNCSYIPIDSITAFVENLFCLMQGTGVGHSVERMYVEKLPPVVPQRGEPIRQYRVADSAEGWADAFRFGLESWFDGYDVEFDYSLVRPAGTPLRTKGGRASGPESLRELLDFSRKVILGAQGRKLRSVECLDIATKTGTIVIVGGTRRSAELSLSDLDDEEMRVAKSGEFWKDNPQRMMANNSSVYLTTPSWEKFQVEWQSLARSGTGERGIYNREAANTTKPARRKEYVYGCNPCAEVQLQPLQFCNLSEVVARPDDDEESLAQKVRVAAIIGTIQSTFTNFPYLRPEWRQHCEEERLLGVSCTGQLDAPAWRNPETMRRLRELVVTVNQEYAARFGINPSTATTTVKPSGSASSVVDASSGIHPRYAPYYIRRVRISAHDPLFMLVRDAGAPVYPEIGQDAETATTWVVEFPVASPPGAITRRDLTAIQQLEFWLLVKENWAEHSVSCTVYVEDHEWDDVGRWVYDHFSRISGLSFLPKDNHIYPLAPYEEIDESTYLKLVENFPPVDYDLLRYYELTDMTEGAQTLACTAGGCDI